MNIDTLDLEGESSKSRTKSFKRYSVESIEKEYKLNINDEDEDNNEKFIHKELKNKKNLPFMIYILIFTSILCIGTLISLIIVLFTYKENYDYEEDIFLKPNISEHNYSRLNFYNGLEIILTQIHYDDTAGGVMTFDKGYLDPKYEPGFLNLAFLSLRHNNRDNMSYLNEYMGSLNQVSEEFYSSTYFTILNSGFQKFLKNFKDYANYSLVDNITDHINRRLNMLPDISSLLNNVNERENHLIEFLVYNITDEKGKDVWRQGIREEMRKKLNYSVIVNISKSLFHPKRIKMLFSSHYKMSLMRKFILRFLNQLTTFEGYEENKDEKKYYTTLNTNKIIYHEIKRNESNYLKINYYINNTEANFDELYIDSGYLNYIKYILLETHENSLYYKLTHPEIDGGLNIKSLSCDFEVVLKKYVRFSISIGLNEYSYNYIKEIIEIIYNHMEKIKAHINNVKSEDERAEELYNIIEQNFMFKEDSHEGEYYKNKAKDLFYKDYHDYFLKEIWLPNDFNKNFTKIKEYINQLNPTKSVIIIGINHFTIEKYNLNNSDSFIFHNIAKTTSYSNISYSIHNLDELKLKINIDKDFVLSNYSNKYISKFGKDTNIPKGENNIYGNYNPLKAKNDDDHLIEFYWLKDTSFRLPKVFVNLIFLHPFLRANYTEQNKEEVKKRNELFFHLMIYLSYIEREINLVLADAIRAGNIFKVGFNENDFYIDIFAYSDQIEKILKIIKEKIFINKNDVFNGTNFAIYRDYAIEEFLNFDKVDAKEKLKLKYYKFLTDNETDFPPIFNYYTFPKNDFENMTIKEAKSLSFLNNPIARGFILGYIEESQAQEISDLFHQNIPDNFNPTLIEAKFNVSKINPSIFVKSCLDRPDRDEQKRENNTQEITNGRTYSFIHFAYYTHKSRIAIELLKKLFAQGRGFRVEAVNQRKIYLRISFATKDYDNTSKVIDVLISELIKRESNYTKDVDVVGDRYYYIKKNVDNEYSKNPYTIRDTAINFSSNFMYRIFKEIEDFNYEIDKYNYKGFKDAMIEILNKKKYNFYELSNKK